MNEQCLCLLDSKKDNDVNEPHPIPRRLCVYNWDTFVCASESESCVRSWVNFVCASESPSILGPPTFQEDAFQTSAVFLQKNGYILHPGATQIWLDRWDPKDQTIRFPRQDSNVNLPVWPENYKLESPTNRWAVFKSPTGWRLQEINTKYIGDDHGPWAASSNQPDQTGLEWPGFWTLRCGCKVVPLVINGL